MAAFLWFVAAALGVVAVSSLVDWVRARKDRRPEGDAGGEGEAAPAAEGSAAVSLLREVPSAAGWLARTVLQAPRLKNLRPLLERSASSMDPAQFVRVSLYHGVALGAFAFLISVSLFWGVASFGLGLLLPSLRLRRRAAARLAKFEEGFPDAVDMLARALRAGNPLNAGIKMVSDEAAEPIAGEFRRVFEENKYGMPLGDALDGLANRLPSRELRFFVTAVRVQMEAGGNLAEMFDNISETTRERFDIRREARVQTAQGRASGYVVSFLPLALGIAIFFIQRDYILTLFREPMGRVLLGIAFGLQVFGYWVIQKIVDIEV